MDFLLLERLGAPLWLWLTFASLIVSLLAFDLGFLNRRDHEIGVRESLSLSAVYIGLGLAFGGVVWLRLGPEMGLAYLTGYIVEKTLSLDNVFVIAMIFMSFSVPRAYQHRVLFWGILFAIALRGVMIGFGAALIANFAWTLYVFSAVLIVTGVKTLFWPSERADAADNALIRFLRAKLNVTERPHGHRFVVRLPHPETGKPTWFATPLFLALVSIEIVDVVFAVDSVPAIFAITTDPFVVYTSNIFAILGLRALFFALSAVMVRLRYLEQTLAIVLIFIGSKIFVADLLGEHLPPWLSLAGSVTIIAAGVLYSLWRTQPSARRWMPRMAAAGAAAASIAGVGWFAWPAGATHYDTELVERGSVIRAVSAAGVIERAPIRVEAKVAGRVVALHCKVGDHVRAGQTCAEIDPGPLLKHVASETRALTAARERLEKSEARLAKAERGRSSAAQRRARTQAARDSAEVERLRAALSIAEAALGERRIVAPVDGVVLSLGRPAEAPGADPVFVIAPDIVTMKVDAGAPGAEEIELGDRASLAAESHPELLLRGEVVAIDRASRKISIEARDPHHSLAEAVQAAAVVIVDRRENALRIPDRAIDYADGKAQAAPAGAPPPGWTRLWKLRDGEPEPANVRLGLGDGLHREVLEGDLRQGDRVIVGEETGRHRSRRSHLHGAEDAS